MALELLSGSGFTTVMPCCGREGAERVNIQKNEGRTHTQTLTIASAFSFALPLAHTESTINTVMAATSHLPLLGLGIFGVGNLARLNK